MEAAADRLEKAVRQGAPGAGPEEPASGRRLRAGLADTLIRALPELLKYPIMGGSIILLLMGAKSCLQIPVDRLAKVGPDGIEFNVETEKQLVELSQSKEELEKRLAALERPRARAAETALPDGASPLASPGVALKLTEKKPRKLGAAEPPGTAAPAEAAEAPGQDAESAAREQEELQTVSDATARLAWWRADGAQPALVLRQRSGFLYLGGFKDGRWVRPVVRLLDVSARQAGRPLPSPEVIAAGDRLVVGSNVVLREGLPSPEQRFPRGVGVLPTGTGVRALGPAIASEAGSCKLYWLKVEVVDRTAGTTE